MSKLLQNTWKKSASKLTYRHFLHSDQSELSSRKLLVYIQQNRVVLGQWSILCSVLRGNRHKQRQSATLPVICLPTRWVWTFSVWLLQVVLFDKTGEKKTEREPITHFTPALKRRRPIVSEWSEFSLLRELEANPSRALKFTNNCYGAGSKFRARAVQPSHHGGLMNLADKWITHRLMSHILTNRIWHKRNFRFLAFL